MDRIAVLVSKHLNFNVAAVVNKPLQHQAAVAKGAQGLAPRAFDGGRKRLGRVRAAHAAPATPGGRFDKQRETQRHTLVQQMGIAIVRRAQIARRTRHARILHAALGQGLVAHRTHGLGRRADKHQPGIQTRLRKVGVFAQKPVARMHRIRAAAPRGIQ